MMLRTLRDIGTIMLNQLHRLVIDPATYIWLAALPLLITYVLGISLGSMFAQSFTPVHPYQVGLVQNSAIGNSSVDVLNSLPELLDVILYDDEATVKTDLLHKTIDAVVIMPPDTMNEPVQILSPPGSIVTQVLHDVLRPFVDQIAVMNAEAAPPAVQVASKHLASVTADSEEPQSNATVSWANASSFQYYSIAIAVMFSMFSANMAMGYCAGDFTTGSFARIRTFGISRATYLFASYLGAVVMAILFMAVMTLITTVFFGVQWGSLSAWIPFTILSSLAVAAITFLIMSIVPTDPKIVDGAGSLVFNLISFLGGSTAPLPALPQWLVSFSTWLPNRAILEGYLRLSGGGTMQSVSGEILIISVNIFVLLSASLILTNLRPKGAV